jgi:hypothetical protein
LDEFKEKVAHMPSYELGRKGMERIYLELFRYNASMDSHGERDKYFMHVIDINEVQIELAKELLEHDLLNMYERYSDFRRIGIWQILLMILCFGLQYSRITFGTSLSKNIPFADRCRSLYSSRASLSILEKVDTVEVIDLWPWLAILFVFHVVEYFLFSNYEDYLNVVNGDKLPSF